MKKGDNKTFEQIEQFANDNDYEIIEHGKFVCGENFVVLKHTQRDITISFVLSGASLSSAVFECIYSDLN